MNLTELLNTIFLSIFLLAAIVIFNFALKRSVSNLHKLSLAFGVFFLISFIVLISSIFGKQIDALRTSYNVRIVIQCLWWFSLNFLSNQLLTYFVWTNLFLSKGISVPKILKDLVSLVLLILTVASIVHFVFDKSVLGLFTASGVVAIILGYSAQATLSDVFAGLGLNIAKQFNEGDWIKIYGPGAGYEGKIIDINWRFVLLLTQEGDSLSIPNSVIAKLAILNYSLPELTRGVVIPFPMNGAHSPEVVKKIMTSAAHQCSKVLKEPAPSATLVQFRGSDYLYHMVYYTNAVNESVVNDEILSIIWYQCGRRGIKTSSSDLLPALSYTQDELVSFLKKTDLFCVLDDEEINLLAANCVYRSYGPPEKILEQGQGNESLFLIYSGGVDVYIMTEAKQEARVASLDAGKYFGEMSLLTGDPCTASIVINTESTIIEINKENMANLFANRPDLIEKISEVVVLRKQQNEDLRALLQKDKSEEQVGLISRLANRVRDFYKHFISKH